MIAAAKLLDALQGYLSSAVTVSSATVGVAEPSGPSDLPAVVISLQQLVNPSRGLGEHRLVQTGALATRTQLPLNNPVLPDDNSITLLSPDRKTLTLFHGGLVDAEGSDTPLQSSDINVERNGNPFTLVSGSPGAGEFSVDPQLGQLQFGSALPGGGTLTADYFIGQWERLVYQLQGQVRIASVANNNGNAENLSNAVYEAMQAQPIPGLRDLEIINVGPVSSFRDTPPAMRARVMEWQFDYECIVDISDSAGGIIERVRLLSSQDGVGVEEEDITLV